MNILNTHQFTYALKAGYVPATDEDKGKWIKNLEDIITVLNIYPEYAATLLKNPRVRGFITNNNDLVRILKKAPQSARDLLLEENNLRPLITNSFQLAEVLEVTPASIAEQLLFGESNLRHLITEDKNLGFVIKALPNNLAEKLLFGEGNLLPLVKNGYTLAAVIERISAPHAENLLFGKDNLRHLITDAPHLLGSVIMNSPHAFIEPLLFGEGNLRPLLKDGDTLAAAIGKISTSHTENLLFGENQGWRLIKNAEQLAKILSFVPDSIAEKLLFKEYQLWRLIHNGSNLATILKAVSKLHTEHLLFGENNLYRLITNGIQLAQIISNVEEPIIEQLLFGEKNARDSIVNALHLAIVLIGLPPALARKLLSDRDPRPLIENVSQFCFLINKMPIDIRSMWIEQLLFSESNIRHLITKGEDLDEVLCLLSAEQTQRLLSFPEIQCLLSPTLIINHCEILIEAAPTMIYDYLSRHESTSAGASAGTSAGGATSPATDLSADFMKDLKTGHNLVRIFAAFARAGIDVRAQLHMDEFLYLIQDPADIIHYLMSCAQFSGEPEFTIARELFKLQQAQPAFNVLENAINVNSDAFTSANEYAVYAMCFQRAFEEYGDEDMLTLAVDAYFKAMSCKEETLSHCINSVFFDLKSAAKSWGIPEDHPALQKINSIDLSTVLSEREARITAKAQQQGAANYPTRSTAGAGAGGPTSFFTDPEQIAREEEARKQRQHDKQLGLVIYTPSVFKK